MGVGTTGYQRRKGEVSWKSCVCMSCVGCVCGHMCTHVWRSEDSLGCHSSDTKTLSSLFF